MRSTVSRKPRNIDDIDSLWKWSQPLRFPGLAICGTRTARDKSTGVVRDNQELIHTSASPYQGATVRISQSSQTSLVGSKRSMVCWSVPSSNAALQFKELACDELLPRGAGTLFASHHSGRSRPG